jgi:hypothetical protein
MHIDCWKLPYLQTEFFLSPFFIEAFAAWRCRLIAGDSLRRCFGPGRNPDAVVDGSLSQSPNLVLD